jgi:outer membrane protein assembly factor BamB
MAMPAPSGGTLPATREEVGMRGWVTPLAVSCLLLGGCSSSEAENPAADSSAAPSTSATTSTAPEGFPVVAADAVQEQRWRLPGGPDALAVDDAGVWVKHDDGTVVHVDAATGEVDVTTQVEGDTCQGLGSGLGWVWACAGPGLARIDPATGEIDDVLPVEKAFSQIHLVTGFDRLWVLSGDGTSLVGVDPGSGAAVTTVPLGARGSDVAVGAAGLWVVSALDGQVLRVDPAGTVALRVTDLGEPVALSVSDTVWVGATGETRELDPTTGTTLVSSAIGTGRDGSVAEGEGAVWVRSTDRFLVRLDPATGMPTGGVSADVDSGGDTVVAFGSVWTTAYDDAALFRIPVDVP